jgi:NifU-like protein involved in Fe-S cluster formation
MAAGMNAPTYTTDILRLAASLAPPHQLHRIDGHADVRSPTCGSTIATDVTVEDDRVTGMSQRVAACAFGQASAALVERSAVGHDRHSIAAAMDSLVAWLGGERSDPGDWPGFDALAPARSKTARHGAILLPFRALLAAMDSAR